MIQGSSRDMSGSAAGGAPASQATAANDDSGGGSTERQTLDLIILSFCESIIRSNWWKTLIVVFTILLLFGSPIQFLCIPKEGDFVFDVLYTIALSIFALDMLLHLLAEPEYFGVDFFCRGRRDSPSASLRQEASKQREAKLWTCGIGSFAFWCDLVSTVSWIHDISYLNGSRFATPLHEIHLTDTGVPSNFGLEVNKNLPIEPNISLLIVIAKTARVARFIRSATVVKVASRLNFYWYVERCNPTWYYHRYIQYREKARQAAEEERKHTKSGSEMRRPNWGSLEIAALAAIKADASEKRAKKKRTFLGSIQTRVFGIFHVTPKKKHREMRRHIAATRIQRAWRNRLAKPHFASMSDDGMALGTSMQDIDEGQAWMGRSTSGFGGVLKKRTRNSGGENSSRVSSGKSRTRDVLRRKIKEDRPQSQVGSAMGELTGQRVATGILFAFVLTYVFTYAENDATKAASMVMLHGQTIGRNLGSAERAVIAARQSSISDLFSYDIYPSDSDYGRPHNFPFVPVVTNNGSRGIDQLRDREMVKIVVRNYQGETEGLFVYRHERVLEAIVELASTVFVLLIWFFGVNAFAGPVMTLVIIPIERMVRLLGMLMLDPLGYQSTSRFKKFLLEEDTLVSKTQWTKEVLKGMETSFLMSTILRIGSLMKVGFGSAGVEIIRNNLQRGQNNNMLILNSQGSTVACIFLFCDIRQFTDATECLQEEVFVFTNRIAAVVHSICHSYGGSANKNVGDAFLVSWLLEDEASHNGRFGSQSLTAKNSQADKALLSVVRICMALHYDDFYVETMSNTAREALLKKLKNRPGPVVQMGFGLHAGKAVQGAIGSQRKIDATYVSEAVERSEFLESSTKQYGVKMLMSDCFHRLLHHSNRRRCRKIDQIIFSSDEQEGDEDGIQGDTMELFTYDMDIDALWRGTSKGPGDAVDSSDTESIVGPSSLRKQNRDMHNASSARGSGNLLKRTRRLSVRRFDDIKNLNLSDELKSSSNLNSSLHDNTGDSLMSQAAAAAAAAAAAFTDNSSAHLSLDSPQETAAPKALVLPTGPALYNANLWLQEDMRRIRHRYTIFVFQKFNSGLEAYYGRDWETAKQCFDAVCERFQDGPSKYFLGQMEKHGGTPPRDFIGYGRA